MLLASARYCCTRVKCLGQEHITITPARAWIWAIPSESSKLTTITRGFYSRAVVAFDWNLKLPTKETNAAKQEAFKTTFWIALQIPRKHVAMKIGCGAPWVWRYGTNRTIFVFTNCSTVSLWRLPGTWRCLSCGPHTESAHRQLPLT